MTTIWTNETKHSSTWSNQSKTSSTWTNEPKTTYGATVAGSPIGLLLALTYAVTTTGSPIVWTNELKS